MSETSTMRGQAGETASMGASDVREGDRAGARSRVAARAAGGGGGGSRRLWLAIATRVVVVSLILLASIGTAGALVATKPKVGHVPVAELVRRVLVVETREVDVARRWEGFGTLRAMDVSEVSAQISARVERRPARIEPGARVRAGEVIVVLDGSDFASRLEQAEQTVAALEAQLAGLDVQEQRTGEQVARSDDEIALAESELERVRESVRQGAGNQIEIDRLEQSIARLRRESAGLLSLLEQIPLRRSELRATIGAQQASAATARRDLERATIVSPIDGVLQRVDVREGDFVGVGSPIARVVGLSRLEAPLRLPASSASMLRGGQGVTLRTVGPDAGEVSGVIERIAPESDASRRDVTVFVEVQQDAERVYTALDGQSGESEGAGGVSDDAMVLLPGRFVVGEVESSSRERRLIVPRRALNQDRVLVARSSGAASGRGEGGAELRVEAVQTRVVFYTSGRFPTLDESETQWAAVEGGLREGDLVIVSNLDELRPGMLVEVRGSGSALRAGDEGGAR